MIDEIPLEWLYGPGVVLDMRHKEPGAEITGSDVGDALALIDHDLGPRTRSSYKRGPTAYWKRSIHGAAIWPGAEATEVREILEALEARDADRAAEACMHHVGEAARTVLEAMSKSQAERKETNKQ